MSSPRSILLTGATGLIGGELLPLLLARSDRISALVRTHGGNGPDARLRQRIDRGLSSDIEVDWSRLKGVSGDLTCKGLGLSAEDARQLSGSIDLIVHCAAETSFLRDQGCQRINVEGMANLIDFAKRCRKAPLMVHISTATVCGAVRDRCVSEETCDPDGEHHNEYTRTKALAEAMLMNSGLEYLVLRPSITVSAGLRDPVFARAILWFLPLLNQLEAVPIRPSGRLDMITVSFAAQAIVSAIEANNRNYSCYHISAGRESITLGRTARFLDQTFGRIHPLRLMTAEQWTGEVHRRYVRTTEQRKTFAALRHYLPFLNMNVTYDNSRLRELLGENMPTLEPFESYAGDLLEVMSPELLPEA